jgi:hypothetical protein
MKTFHQFMEQIPTPSNSEKESARRQMEHDRRVSLRQQRNHVRDEMKTKETQERQDMFA